MDESVTISKKHILILSYGILISWGLALHMYIMFLRAYASDQKAIALYINYFGEANIELVLMTISIIIGAISTGYVLWIIHNKKQITYSG